MDNRRVAELEAENAALRRALAAAGTEAALAADRHGADLSSEKARRAEGATEAREASAEAEARHGREMAASLGDLAASEESNAALRRANAALTESRAALRENQERLRLILDSASDYAIFSMDTERRIASWNAGAERLLGWSEAEIVGQPADVIFTPEDRAGGAPEQEGEGALRDGRAADERWHLRKDGTRFWANGLMLPLRDPEAGPASPPLGLLKVMRDETGKRRAEEALREGEARWRGLFERMHEGFAHCEMVYGPDGSAVDYRHLELNAAWGRLTGVPVEAVQGRLVSEAIPGIEPFWFETFARVAETGEPAHFEHHLAVYGRWFDVRAYRPGPGRFAALFTNVTERKRAEARRDALLELGDRLRDLRDAADIAHAAAEIIGRTLGAARAGYGTVDAAQEVLRVERDWADGRVGSIAREHRLAEYWDDFAALYGKGEPIAVRDTASDPRTAARAGAYAAAEIRAVLDVPLVEAGRVAAILYVHDSVPRAWTAEEVAFVRGAADRAWAAAERARAEAAIAESEARWRGLFESMQEGVEINKMVYGPDGRPADFRYLDVNTAWERHTGIPREAAVGRLLSEVVPGLDPFWIETYARVVETGEPAHVERFVPQRGRWYEVRVHRTAGTGRFGALLMDVTGRKAAEARQAALVELGDRLRDLRDPGEIARTATEVIGRALGASRAGYGAVEHEETLRVERDWTGGPEVASVAGEWRLSEYWTGFARDLRRGEVVAIHDVERDPRTASQAEALLAIGVHAQVVVPVVERGRVAALLFVHDAAPRDWAAEEVAFVRGAADRAWAAAERARAERRRALLLGELNHRVKNTLAVVQSLAMQTARGAPDLPAFSAAFQARLVALARAHDLLTRENWEGAALDDVVRAALEPGGGGRVDLLACGGGPDAPLLAPAQALALALALHELGTNALKHGALSVPGGRVSVRCAAAPEDGAHVLEWLERGGPPIAAPPSRRGFGLRLLERGLAVQAGMTADLRFEPEGLRCALRLPNAR